MTTKAQNFIRINVTENSSKHTHSGTVSLLCIMPWSTHRWVHKRRNCHKCCTILLSQSFIFASDSLVNLQWLQSAVREQFLVAWSSMKIFHKEISELCTSLHFGEFAAHKKIFAGICADSFMLWALFLPLCESSRWFSKATSKLRTNAQFLLT